MTNLKYAFLATSALAIACNAVVSEPASADYANGKPHHKPGLFVRMFDHNSGESKAADTKTESAPAEKKNSAKPAAKKAAPQS